MHGFPHLVDAVDDAVEAGDGDLLIDAAASNSGLWLLVGKIEGKVASTEQGRQ